MFKFTPYISYGAGLLDIKGQVNSYLGQVVLSLMRLMIFLMSSFIAIIVVPTVLAAMAKTPSGATISRMSSKT